MKGHSRPGPSARSCGFVDDGSSGVLRMRDTGVGVTIAVGWFLIQCSSDMAIANFHSSVQVRKSQAMALNLGPWSP